MELKAYKGDIYVPMYGSIADAKVYLKSEADKLLAELEESHKMEVEQLLMEMVELKKQVHDYAQGLYVIQARAEKEARHHKYKRCLAMAMWCEFYADSLRVKRNQCRYDEAELAETYYIRCRRYRRWCKVWKELAEKFKE